MGSNVYISFFLLFRKTPVTFTICSFKQFVWTTGGKCQNSKGKTHWKAFILIFRTQLTFYPLSFSFYSFLLSFQSSLYLKNKMNTSEQYIAQISYLFLHVSFIRSHWDKKNRKYSLHFLKEENKKFIFQDHMTIIFLFGNRNQTAF